MTYSFRDPSPLPYQLPDFASIKHADYRSGFEAGMKAHREEIEAICAEPVVTWENTVEAWERSGQELDRVSSVFYNLLPTISDDELEEIGAWVAPLLAAHNDWVYLNEELYRRVCAVTAPDDPESQRLHTKLLDEFRRRGATLSPADKEKLVAINERLSVLSEEFSRTQLNVTKELAVHVADAAELAGMSAERIAAAEEYAREVGKDGYVIPLEIQTIHSEISTLEVPKTRQRLLEASLARREATGDILVEMVQLRAQRAELLGFASHADYVIAEETAKESSAVWDFLRSVAPNAATNARHEFKLIEELADGPVGAADWQYWESRVRARDFAIDEDELIKYFPLERVLVDGVFYAANLLYGIEVVKRPDLRGYAEDVDVWEVFDGDGTGIGLLVTDLYGRPSKRGGAWMSQFIGQSELLGTKPVVTNVMSLPGNGLLNLDGVRTLFHEFGHALHGLLSQVRYPRLSGTNVPRDFVEFPSQINENWALEPVILRNYAKHVDTGEPLPIDTVAALAAARQWGQGFATSEYVAAAVVDLAWHSLSAKETASLTKDSIDQHEQQALAAVGLDVEHLHPRYHSGYFSHIFGGGYSAGYYSYLWAEALDADGFAWFEQQEATGDNPTPAAMRSAGEHFRTWVLSKGASIDAMEAFRQFRGRDKDVAPLLARRGL